MNSLFYVSAVSAHKPGIYREVSIGRPSVSDEPNSDAITFYGSLIKMVDDEGRDILSVHDDAEDEVSVYKGNGEVTAFGAYTSLNNGFKTLSVYNGELCTSLITGEVFVLGGGSLTADGEQKTISLINAKDERGTTVSVISGSFHTIPGKRTSLNGCNIGLNRSGYTMNITVLGEKSEDGTKAELNIDENEDTTSFSGGSIVFEHSKASISVTDGDARIDMPNGYTSLSGDSVVLRYGDKGEIFLSNARVVISHTECRIYMNGSGANFRINGEDLFVPKVKDAHMDCSTGKISCNGEVVCYEPLLKQLGKQLFKADPKPASAMIS